MGTNVEFWIWLDTQKGHLAIVAGVLSALAVIYKYLGSRTVEFVKDMLFMLNARETTTQIYSKLDNIMSQLVPNGGTSIRDSLNRIEDKQHFLGAFIKTQMNTGDKALFQTDEHGDYIWVNRPHSRLTGYQAGEVMGDGWINLVAPECRIHTMELWLSAVKALREFNETLWFIKTDNKTRYLVRVHAYTIDHRDGTVAGYLGEVTPLGQEESKPVNCNVFRSMAGPTV